MNITADGLADPEQFEKQTEGELMDCYASSPTAMDNLSVSFVKGSLLTDLDASIEVSIDMITEMYEQSGYAIEASKPAEVKLGNQAFKKVVLTEKIGEVGITQYVYFAMFNDYLVNISCTTADYSGMTDAEFEQMIS